MFTVYAHDDLVCDSVVVFEGTLEECIEYVDGDEEFEVVAEDEFTVVEI